MSTLCFVLMPFGIKTDGNKKEIDFDNVYKSFIEKAIIATGLQPIRADEEKTGGFIHKPMYERLMFCEFAVADLSFANANVFYELGIRHALRPYTTVSVFELGTKIPFDTAPLRTFPYAYENGAVQDVEAKIKELSELIKVNINAQKLQEDSPIGQLIKGYKYPDLKPLQADADAFAEKVTAINDQKEQLTNLARQWKDIDKTKAVTDDEKNKKKADQRTVVDAMVKIEKDEGSNLKFNYDLLYAIVTAYKSVSAFAEIIAMLKPMVAGIFKENIYIKQQLGLAYNKTGNRDDAETVLKTIIDKYGPDPETNGLLGAVYKGLMDDNKNEPGISDTHRGNAIDTYLAGFEADPRDYYPGINALTLMYFSDIPDERFNKFLPLVTYAVERELRTKSKDYWAQATALEIAVLGMNEKDAEKHYAAAVICQPDQWMKESTAGNLKKIYEKALASNNAGLTWLKEITNKLNPGSIQ